MTTRVGIVGCGKIADQHVHAINRIPNSHVVAVCDRELLMAQQIAERFSIDRQYQELSEMLRSDPPDVIHITTPPQSHFALALQCIEAGCHVYIEKPFTINTQEAEELIAAAERAQVLVVAGHNCQFTPEMIRMRNLLQDGYCGERLVHIESYWPYSLEDISYVAPMLANPDHWVRRLPGQLLHNIISHGISRIAEFLTDDIVEFNVFMGQSEQLRRLGGMEIVDELRVMLCDSAGVTATFCFSTQIKPGQNCLRLFGSKNSLIVDTASSNVVKIPGRGYKSYLTFVRPQLRFIREYARCAIRNFFSILGMRLYQDAGLKELIERFHHCVVAGDPPPIPYREIILTSKILDRIFEHYPSRPKSEIANVAAADGQH